MSNFKYFYCPVCGKILASLDNSETCNFCQTEMLYIKQSENWEEKSVNERQVLMSQLRETLVKTNPLYNEEKFKAREYDESHMEFGTTPNLPKCPVCGSTNIQKISTASKIGAGIAFGVFSLGHISKTFKCKNCGYKF
ncbi:DZANK-type domain-containing protein [Ruminococcaceae bacterium BL-6]|nr:DZANK-type domain-containing protein [Ruminococcaceae bacterium BL-6]